MPAVMDPAGTGDNFTDRYKDDWNYQNFRERIISYADKVKQAYDETDREKSIGLWQDTFGTRFKPGASRRRRRLAPFSAGVPGPARSSSTRRRTGFPIAARPGRAAARHRPLHWTPVGNVTAAQRLPARSSWPAAATACRRTAACSSPPDWRTCQGPYRVFWKVRNGGQRGRRAAKQLRGEISESSNGSMLRTETTSYKGTHYVECYVVKDGVVVARNRQTVIVT